MRLVELIERARAGNRAHFEVRQLRCDVDVDPELVVAGRSRSVRARDREPARQRDALRAARRPLRDRGASATTQGVEIAIGNSGPPVPAAERDAIFGRYFQVERRRASARANRGLGLYFCKLAVEAHGGTIHVEERGDLGAVFVVRLPDAPSARPT